MVQILFRNYHVTDILHCACTLDEVMIKIIIAKAKTRKMLNVLKQVASLSDGNHKQNLAFNLNLRRRRSSLTPTDNI